MYLKVYKRFPRPTDTNGFLSLLTLYLRTASLAVTSVRKDIEELLEYESQQIHLLHRLLHDRFSNKINLRCYCKIYQIASHYYLFKKNSNLFIFLNLSLYNCYSFVMHHISMIVLLGLSIIMSISVKY